MRAFAFDPNDYVDSAVEGNSEDSVSPDLPKSNMFNANGESDFGVEYHVETENRRDMYSTILSVDSERSKKTMFLHHTYRQNQSLGDRFAFRQELSVWFLSSTTVFGGHDSISEENAVKLAELWHAFVLQAPIFAQLTLGRKAIEKGPGLGENPTYILPLAKFNYDSRDKKYEQSNAWLIQSDISVLNNVSLESRFFPKIESDWENSSVFSLDSQEQAFEVQVNVNLFTDLYMTLGWYREEVNIFKLTSEYLMDTWQFYVDAIAYQSDRPLQKAETRYKTAIGIQNDLPGIFSGYRISMECDLNNDSWTTQQHREFQSLIKSARELQDDPRQPLFVQQIGTIAQDVDLESTYFAKGLFRVGTVSGKSLSWSLNAIPYFSNVSNYFVDGAIFFADLEYRFMDHFEISSAYYQKKSFIQNSTFSHIPLDKEWHLQLHTLF